MKTFIQPGEKLDYTNSSGSTIAGGAVVTVAGRVGVVVADILDTETGTVYLEGVHQLAKATSESWAVGDELYWDGSASKLTKTAAANTHAGFAVAVAASDATSGRVKLSPETLNKAANVAALGATTNLVGVDGAGSNAAPLAGTETRLDAIETKVDAILTSMKNAGLMATS